MHGALGPCWERLARQTACTVLVVTVLVVTVLACGASAPPAESPSPAGAAPEPEPEPESDFDAEAYMEDGSAQRGAADVAPDEPAPAGQSARADRRRSAPLKRDPGAEEARTVRAMYDIVQNNRQPFRECYESFLQRSPGVKGDLTIQFVVDPQGKVKSAELNPERSTLTEPRLVSCAVEAMKRLRFPASSRGFESTVNYPFNFNP